MASTIRPLVLRRERAILRAHGVRTPTGVAAPAVAHDSAVRQSATRSSPDGCGSTTAGVCTRVLVSPLAAVLLVVNESTLLRQGIHAEPAHLLSYVLYCSVWSVYCQLKSRRCMDFCVVFGLCFVLGFFASVACLELMARA